MKNSTYTKFQTVPLAERYSGYGDSFKLEHNLWVLPTYNVGEVWRWFNCGERGDFEVIQVLSEYQILFRIHLAPYESKFTGLVIKQDPSEQFFLGTRRNKNVYIETGSPELRKRIK